MKNTNYFHAVRISLKFSFKLVTFSKSYARKQHVGVFFSEHGVVMCPCSLSFS